MNWKFTKVKTIVSVSVFIIFLIILTILGQITTARVYTFRWDGVQLGFLFGISISILTFLIWSLIQKKEIVEIQKKGTDDNIKEAQQ